MNQPLSAFAAMAVSFCAAGTAWAQGTKSANPDEFIKTAIETVVTAAKQDPAARDGDINATARVVEREFLPYTDFERTTRLALGPAWGSATPEQRQTVFQEFQRLLVRTYALQLTQIRDQKVTFRFDRAQPVAKTSDVVVQSEVRGASDDALKVGYRLGKTAAGWKIYDIDMMGSWAIVVYRQQFATAMKNGGVDGLIRYLKEHNARLG
ncbi:MlaC/ttg2D family ABC transporter substrate-binding protein [Chitinasiproducens palmae]|uniref:ABC-type transporter Mla maintaining outer membrane lipid asymmetry, MlaC component n=1 Tax=Chitinasiproducens palmae TaxID=1770053 RepID=A0A1H2PSB9_9BURK|nr:ABC transporter substrate-binding protein [Chitinasiproducens palmae]SDV49870.1 ABC-type transporter Mla maintaining outer membrane lipid asymmetry, MlaC component [Chitinasiproducens palmae]